VSNELTVSLKQLGAKTAMPMTFPCKCFFDFPGHCGAFQMASHHDFMYQT